MAPALPLPASASRGSRHAFPGDPGPTSRGSAASWALLTGTGQRSGTGTETRPGQSFPGQLEAGARRRPRGRPVGASLSLQPSDPPPGPRPPPSLCLPLLTSILPHPLGLGLRLPTAATTPQSRSAPVGTLLAPSFRIPGSSLRPPAGRSPRGEARMIGPSRRPCPRVPAFPHVLPHFPGAQAALPMGLCMGAREGTPGGRTERGDRLEEGGGGGCLAGGGAGAGAGSQAGGFVCEKNRGLARVGTLASLNANGARGHRLLSPPWGPQPLLRPAAGWNGHRERQRVPRPTGLRVSFRARGRRAGELSSPTSCSPDR